MTPVGTELPYISFGVSPCQGRAVLRAGEKSQGLVSGLDSDGLRQPSV